MKILLIDDNETITKALSKFLTFKKHECTVVNDGRNAVELIKTRSFDVVLLDLAMPGFTGIDVVDELVKEDKVKNQKIIVLTATTIDEDTIVSLKKKGVYSIQRKPMDVDTLIEIMS